MDVKINSASTYKKMLALTKPYWGQTLLAISFGLMVSAVMGAIAWLVKPALDIVFVQKNYQYLKYFPIAVIVLFTVKGVLNFFQQYFMKRAGLSLIRDTQNKLHNHILYLPVKYFDKEASGILMSRVISDVDKISAIFSEALRAAIIEVPKIFVLLGIAFYRKWDVTLTNLLIVPILAYTANRIGKKVKQRSHQAQKSVSYLTHRLSESITGNRVIKVFNRQPLRNEKYITDNEEVFSYNVKAIRFKELNKLVIDTMTGIAIGIVLVYGGRQVVMGLVTPGDFASILTAIYLVFSPVKQVGESYTTLQGIRASLERIDHVLDSPIEESGSIAINSFEKDITFENVSFKYVDEHRHVLRNINLSIRHGEVIALVGPSGAGKTSLVHLIPRFYKPTEGRITIDGTDTADVDISALRELIGIVSQDILLFNETIKDNILFGQPTATDAEIKTAARLSYADEFIDKLPEGYESKLGDRGLNLSGGQRQRIAIARAVLKNPPILILDEATSSLDSVSESLVQKALETLMKGRTTIVVAHRLSTIKNADRIVVIKDGEIAGIGTHESLIQSNEQYKTLYSTFALS
ncbi:MAG: ABC transporter ATP-binding protein [Nitrospirae bacterium]|nr:ABC transporter ATP-binding protein [Nitrospirota bacterium]MBF0536194.1 ABC transporter ATP-binding protein [Nitrospirota bacterium]